MYSVVRGLLTIAAVIALPVSASHAVTLTFDGVPYGDLGCPPNAGSVAEGGFTISNCPGYYLGPGEIHLDDGGSALQNSVDFSAPTRFNAVSVLIEGLGQHFFDPDSNSYVSFDNVLFQGFRNGAVVATQKYSTFSLPITGTALVLFGPDFMALDMLRITQAFPGPDAMAAYPNAYCDDVPCGHVSLLEINLTPIPLPASLPLFAGVIAVLGIAGWRRGRVAA